MSETVVVMPAPDGAGSASPSAVSWPAILGGAFAAAGVTVILLALGSGLGLAVGVAKPGPGQTVATFTVTSGIWLILTQWFSAGLGGYLTGRLRVRWPQTHVHEVFFRDTANGFLAWAVATVLVVGVVAAGALALADTAAHGASAKAAGAYDYNVYALLRSPRPDESPSAALTQAEAQTVLARQVTAPQPSADDQAWLASLVENRTGLAPDAAQQRVNAVVASARETADKARKATAATSIFTALAMVVGAFIACVAAALGGLQRDEHI